MIIQSIFGLLVLTALAWAASENRRLVRPGRAALGLGIQFIASSIDCPWICSCETEGAHPWEGM